MPNKEIYLVTSNPSKFFEISKTLRDFNIKGKRINYDVPEIKSEEIEEVVIDKALKAYSHAKKPIIVDDTGIFFSHYNNFPGTHSRFVIMGLGFEGIFRLLKGQDRAYFKTMVAYMAPGMKKPKLFSGVCRGHMLTRRRGRMRAKMPYDDIFIPDGDSLTFSQMGVENKQKYDHRSKAIKRFAKWYTQARQETRPIGK
ncbi:non-canonical purine NTP pyrophosphatase [Patescibacteria group bacterium]|nr:non-canonical purine NTP pyrophosphatase [Patescibacteria group bacterium]MBU1673875.1 non-canonical purine NTP pyrophosphatase [Patescibacteria group bacterium]MBU1963252.1 non-canonical purine NTP pyrophosphatase [Patescibacteria group bacterium]